MVADRVQLSLLERREQRRPLKQGQSGGLSSVAGIEGTDDLGAPIKTESEVHRDHHPQPPNAPALEQSRKSMHRPHPACESTKVTHTSS